MKFNVREGFVVAYVDRIKQGDKTVERAYAFYPEDGTIDLDKAHALDHAHKIEGADKDAAKLLEGLVLPASAPTAATGVIDVQGIVAAAVQAALAAQAAVAAAPAAAGKGA